MKSARIEVPAKAMLFGEYGVLEGGPAVAVTLPQFRFVVELSCGPGRGDVEVVSSFLATGNLHFSYSNPPSAMSSRDERFFRGALAPFTERLADREVRIAVLESFSPSLGFGSSSALLVAIHRGIAALLGENVGNAPSALDWIRLRESLLLVQGGGSGYDVAVQWVGQGHREPRVWSFESGEPPRVSPVDVDSCAELGCFVATGLYSDTAAAIKKRREPTWGLDHAAIARDFLRKPNVAALPELMRRSRAVAARQGLLGESGGELAALAAALADLPWKTMGAGGGDCLWVAAPRAALAAHSHPARRGTLLESVVFAFEERGEC